MKSYEAEIDHICLL